MILNRANVWRANLTFLLYLLPKQVSKGVLLLNTIQLRLLRIGTPIEFSITGGGQDYIDLSNTELYVKVKVLRADNTPITATDPVGPINSLLHSLFSEVDISLNDTVVTSSNNTYAYRAYLETLLSYGPSAKKSQLTSALYYKDVAGHMNDSNPHHEDSKNVGFQSRSAFSTRGTFDMVGIIHSDLFFQSKFLLNDINIKKRLVRNKDSFCLMMQHSRFELSIVSFTFEKFVWVHPCL